METAFWACFSKDGQGMGGMGGLGLSQKAWLRGQPPLVWSTDPTAWQGKACRGWGCEILSRLSLLLSTHLLWSCSCSKIAVHGTAFSSSCSIFHVLCIPADVAERAFAPTTGSLTRVFTSRMVSPPACTVVYVNYLIWAGLYQTLVAQKRKLSKKPMASTQNMKHGRFF